MDKAQTQKAIVAIETAIGLGAVFAPKQLVRAYGIRPEDVDGLAVFAFRLFGIRNLAVGLANARGEQWAKDLTLAVQAPDALMFAHAARTGYVPKQAAVGALATAGLVTALALKAR